MLQLNKSNRQDNSGNQPKIRIATAQEVNRVFHWAAELGWNPTINDIHANINAINDGFFVLEKDNEIIGSISVVNYGLFAFLGLLIIEENSRGNKYGALLWHKVLDCIKNCHNTGLYS